eukprot:TRINITY_DN73615_c0_g1_i1.p1 TRINITY_DN73615_c0_g1~~TRINITY_DN73615_c0_g1_i1.p1  ORF type:complete len:352 (-),score=27.05 TRINITY_DN73615_c0_g1_i1:45-1100(-)
MPINRPDDEVRFAPTVPGSFQRGACKVQHWISLSPKSGYFPPVRGRYHLFLNYGCGWCHQVLLVRALKGLQAQIGVSHLGLHRVGRRGSESYGGWNIPEDCDASGNKFRTAREIYNCADNKYGVDQLTIPVLFDTVTKRVVSNDPAHILLMLDDPELFPCDSSPRLYLEDLQEDIEAVNAVVFPGVNDGVYRCWFSEPSSEAFKHAFQTLQSALGWLESRLQETGSFLCGPQVSLADVRAFPHLVRFDLIFHNLMLRGQGPRIDDTGAFPHLLAWLQRMFCSVPGVAEACDLQVATRFYFSSKPVAESDAIYASVQESEAYSWLPAISCLEQKRFAEGLVAAQIDIPADHT